MGRRCADGYVIVNVIDGVFVSVIVDVDVDVNVNDGVIVAVIVDGGVNVSDGVIVFVNVSGGGGVNAIAHAHTPVHVPASPGCTNVVAAGHEAFLRARSTDSQQ